MKIIVLILSLLFFLPPSFPAQDNKGTGPKQQSVRRELSIKKQRRKDAREKRKMERAERKAIEKHHKRIQTKKVQKRMKSSRSKAMRNNQHKREFFLKRWFSRKHK
jgi:hypothetical protein